MRMQERAASGFDPLKTKTRHNSIQGQTPLERMTPPEHGYWSGTHRDPFVYEKSRRVRPTSKPRYVHPGHKKYYPKEPPRQRPKPAPAPKEQRLPFFKDMAQKPFGKLEFQELLYLMKKPKFRNLAIDVIIGIIQTHYETYLDNLPAFQPQLQAVVDLTGTNWSKVDSCGPWREDSILPGGNFCFVGLGVPYSGLYQPLPSGVSNAYTVQINGGEVPGGIDCTASQFYASATPFTPDPVPVFRPARPGVLLPDQPSPFDPYNPATAPIGQVVPYPAPPPVRGPLSFKAPGGIVGNGSPGGNRFNTKKRRDVRPDYPPHELRKPRKGEKEKKTKISLGRLAGLIKGLAGMVTEFAELVDAVYSALPWEIRRDYAYKKGGLSVQEKLRILYRNFQHLKMEGTDGLIFKLINNHVTDFALGKVGKALKHSVQKNPYWTSPVGLQAGGRYRGVPVYVNPA